MRIIKIDVAVKLFDTLHLLGVKRCTVLSITARDYYVRRLRNGL